MEYPHSQAHFYFREHVDLLAVVYLRCHIEEVARHAAGVVLEMRRPDGRDPKHYFRFLLEHQRPER
jgi:hypothetical protein